jgi:hypothetical protein
MFATGATSQTISNIAVQTTEWRSAQLIIKRCDCAVRIAESCRQAGRTLLATPATAWQPGDAPRRSCGIAARAAAKPAAAARAHWRERVRTGCHTCAHVPTRAHTCATGAAFRAISHIALRTICRTAQLVITHGACAACVVESCREAGRTLLPTPATAWQVKCRGRAAAAVHVQQPSQLQPRVRVGACRCAQGATCADSCAHVLTGAQQVPHSRRLCTLHCERAGAAGSYL